METLGNSSIRTFLKAGWTDGEEEEDNCVTNRQIRTDDGYLVDTFSDLVTCVAKLAFYNRDHVLLFRGQKRDHKTPKGLSSVQPTIFRKGAKHIGVETLGQRFRILDLAESKLVARWRMKRLEELQSVARQRILRWAILQHYQVCDTPLLDVSQSLRIAASFAFHGSPKENPVLYVFAVPQISGAVTASAEAGLQIVRLSSICPPSAKRPHFQEGLLLGQYPEISTVLEKEYYPLFEIDFGRRLLCKFRLRLDHFWQDPVFPKVPKSALYPERRNPSDPLARAALEIAAELKSTEP